MTSRPATLLLALLHWLRPPPWSARTHPRVPGPTTLRRVRETPTRVRAVGRAAHRVFQRATLGVQPLRLSTDLAVAHRPTGHCRYLLLTTVKQQHKSASHILGRGRWRGRASGSLASGQLHRLTAGGIGGECG